MSSHPHKEGVSKVCDLIIGQKHTRDLVNELRDRIANDTDTLETAQQTWGVNAKAIFDEMQKMDLTSPSKSGHEQRMQAFLIMLTELTIEGVT